MGASYSKTQQPQGRRSGSHRQYQRQRHQSSHLAPSSAGARAPPVMPSFFSFQQGSETVQNIRYSTEASPLLGRFRAVPRPSDLDRSSPRRARSTSQLGLLSAGWRGSVHVGYGALIAAGLEAAAVDEDADDRDDEGGEDSDPIASPGRQRRSRLSKQLRRIGRRLDDTWVNPKAGAVRRTVDRWWSRWGVLVVLPAALVGQVRSLVSVPVGSYEDGEHVPRRLTSVMYRLWLGVLCRSHSTRCRTTTTTGRMTSHQTARDTRQVRAARSPVMEPPEFR